MTARLRASLAILAASQRIVLTRDKNRCVLCGSPFRLQAHHRLPRGMGGSSRNPLIHSPANLITLCMDDHSWTESNRDEARDMGLLVHRGTDPATVPVLTTHGWQLFTTYGTRIPTERNEA